MTSGASPRSNRKSASLLLCAVAAGGLVVGVQFAANRSIVGPASPVAESTVMASGTSQVLPRTRPSASGTDVPVPLQGWGTWHVVPGTSGAVGHGTVHTYTVEVEDGMEVPEGDAAFAQAVQATLSDRRSWVGGGALSVRRIDTGRPDVRIRLSSQGTARSICGYEIPVDVSCRNGDKIDLSVVRWIRGAVAFDGDLANYRRYMVNHEVGHALGEGHRSCAMHGGPAPVMMQQTFSTSNNEIRAITAGHPQDITIPNDGKVCLSNPWPFP